MIEPSYLIKLRISLSVLSVSNPPLLKQSLLQETNILLIHCLFLNILQPLLQMLPLPLQPETHRVTVQTKHCIGRS